MSYSTINKAAGDAALIGRVTAAAAQDGVNPPQTAAAQTIWLIAAKSDIEAAYASALAAGNPAPGDDPAVITDGMILSAFQSVWPIAPPAGAL